jgi:simple sugar transport system permease protein
MSELLGVFLTSSNYWDSLIRVSGPIALAAVAATLCSRAGILYVGVEGVLLIATFFGLAGAAWTDSIWLGVLFAAGAGMCASLLLGVLSMTLRMGDVIGGLVLDIGAVGLTAFLRDELFTLGPSPDAGSLQAAWPSLGNSAADVVFHQQPLIYVALALAIALEFFLRTRLGLRMRLSGESIRAAQTFGVDLVKLRFVVLGVAGIITGLGGAVLGLAIVGSFEPTIVDGKGFIALACVILGAWRPLGAFAAALFFGATYALQFQFDIEALGQWLQILPFVATLAAVGLAWGRAQGPAEEGRGLPVEEAAEAR